MPSVNSPLGKAEPSFPASTSWSYEIGFKAELLGRRLALSGAAFFDDVRDGHLVVFQRNLVFGVATLDYRSVGGELERAFGQSFGVTMPTVCVGQGRILGVGTTLRF